MIPAPTRYARATDVDHALELLAEPDAKAIAGGQSLIPVMKLRIARPSVVVDISRLELRGVEERDGELHIGPLTTWAELASAALPRGLEAIAECAHGIGDVQVRNLGTIGGSVVHADPASDMPAVLLALGARLEVRSPEGEPRGRARATCSSAPSRRALGAQELVTDIVVPTSRAGARAPRTRRSSTRRRASRSPARPRSSTPDGETVALTGVGATPFVLPAGDPRTAIARAEIFGDRFALGGVPPRARRRRRRARACDARRRGGGCVSDTLIGVSRPRVDAPEKVTGATRYAADGYARTACSTRASCSSTEAHARIRGIDKDAALAVPGVVAVLGGRRPPIASRRHRPHGGAARAGGGRLRGPARRARRRRVARPRPRTARKPCSSSTSRSRPSSTSRRPWRPVRRSLGLVEERRSEAGDLESIHAGVDTGSDDGERGGALGQRARPVTPRRGRRRRGLAASDAVVEGTFRTPWVYQALHRAAGLHGLARADRHARRLDEHAGLVRHAAASSLAPSTSRSSGSASIAEPLGGAFGGKFAHVEPLVAGAALALGRPVRLVLTRSEDFQATNPASAQVTDLTDRRAPDGTLTAIDARMIVDRGSNAGWGVEGITSLLVAGPYRWEAHDIRGYGVQTNRFTFGAYRAPGAPTAAFALESLLDELAHGARARPDRAAPAERRRRGRRRRQRQSVPDDRRRRGARADPRAPALGGRATRSRRTRASGWPPATGPAGSSRPPPSAASNSDGSMTVVTSAVDMSGVNTGFAIIAAAAFGLSPDKVRVVTADTIARARTPACSGGSKVTYTVGAAVLRAAEAAREKVLAAASQELEIAPDDLEVVDGVVRAVGAPDRSITVGRSRPRRRCASAGRYEPIEGHGGSAQTRARRRSPRISPTSASIARPARSSSSARDRAGRRPRAEPRARRGPDARRRRAGHGLGALRGARPRRGRTPADGLVPRLRDPDRGARPRDRDAHRRGAGARRPVRREGHRRGARRRRAGRDRERRRGRHRARASTSCR